VTTPLGPAAWAYLPHYMRSRDDGTVAALVEAVAAPVAQVETIITDPAAHTDPGRVPWEHLPRLAALAGIDLTAVPDGEKRAWMADPANYYRATTETVIRRVGLTLTGARQVWVECPHLGDPWTAYVRTLAAETPDPAATLAAIVAEMPAWLVLVTELDAVGISYDALGALYGNYDAVEATGFTYTELMEA